MLQPLVDVRFDHTIIAAKDMHEFAWFFTDIFGLADPHEAWVFVAVRLTDDRVLDRRHGRRRRRGCGILRRVAHRLPRPYVVMVSDDTFEGIMERLHGARRHLLG